MYVPTLSIIPCVGGRGSGGGYVGGGTWGVQSASEGVWEGAFRVWSVYVYVNYNTNIQICTCSVHLLYLLCELIGDERLHILAGQDAVHRLPHCTAVADIHCVHLQQ